MHGQFLRDMPETTDAEQTWNWLRSSALKVQTEALICAAQEQSLRNNYVKHHIDRTAELPLCRMCVEKEGSVSNLISECKRLAQKGYERRHDNVAMIVHWKLSELYHLEREEKWYINIYQKLLWRMLK